MKKNVVNTDRIIRFAIAIVIAMLYVSNVISGISGIVLLIAGGILAFTSFLGFCPIYWILRIKTIFSSKQTKFYNN